MPKKKRYTNRAFLEFVASLPCMLRSFDAANDCSGGVQAHHLLKPWDGSRGMSMRSNDKNAIPLCFKHHAELHDNIGSEYKFFLKYGLEEGMGQEYSRSLFEMFSDK